MCVAARWATSGRMAWHGHWCHQSQRSSPWQNQNNEPKGLSDWKIAHINTTYINIWKKKNRDNASTCLNHQPPASAWLLSDWVPCGAGYAAVVRSTHRWRSCCSGSDIPPSRTGPEILLEAIKTSEQRRSIRSIEQYFLSQLVHVHSSPRSFNIKVRIHLVQVNVGTWFASHDLNSGRMMQKPLQRKGFFNDW